MEKTASEYLGCVTNLAILVVVFSRGSNGLLDDGFNWEIYWVVDYFVVRAKSSGFPSDFKWFPIKVLKYFCNCPWLSAVVIFAKRSCLSLYSF